MGRGWHDEAVTESRRRTVLLVEDDPAVVRAVSRILHEFVDESAVGTAEHARTRIDSDEPLSGAILDVALPDGSGLDLLAMIRDKRPFLPVLLLTARCEPWLIKRAYGLRAQYLCKPATVDELLMFLRSVYVAEHVQDERARQVIESFAAKHRLTLRETEVVALAVKELTRKEMAPAMGVALPTLDSHIASILRKSRQPNLQEIGRRVRQILRGD